MNNNKIDATKLLTRFASQLGSQNNWEEGENNTMIFLAYMARKDFLQLTTEEISAINALCRKVDIVKNVCTSYDASWQKVINKEPVNIATWPVLTAVFLAHAAHTNDKGIALKMVNSAFNAIALYKQLGGQEYTEELTKLANVELQKWLKK